MSNSIMQSKIVLVFEDINDTKKCPFCGTEFDTVNISVHSCKCGGLFTLGSGLGEFVWLKRFDTNSINVVSDILNREPAILGE